MRHASQPRRDQRVEPAEKTGFENAGADLRRPDHHAGENGLRRCGAKCFHDPRQVRRHRRRHRPGGGEGEREHHHGAVDRDVRLGCLGFQGDDPIRAWQRQIERQADQDVRQRPGVACLAPSDHFKPERAQRPADRAGEAGDQRDAGDRAARILSVDAAERSERGVVKAEAHADTEQQPRSHHQPDRCRRAQESQAGREHDIGGT